MQFKIIIRYLKKYYDFKSYAKCVTVSNTPTKINHTLKTSHHRLFQVAVPVPVDRPYAVPVPKPYPVTVEKHVAVPVDRPVPVPVPHAVPYPVIKQVSIGV